MSETPTLAEVLKDAMRAELLDVHTMLPCSVKSYDSETQKASLIPLLRKKYRDETIVDLPVINDVPVQWPSGGGAFIHFPLSEGDTGMAIFCERSLDIWLSGEGETVTPNDPRHHDITDAVFIPCVRTFKTAFSGIIGTSIHIKHGDAEIELTSGGNVNILGGNIKLDAATLIDVLAATINLGTGAEKAVLGDTLASLYAAHTHSGVTSGPSVTGPPSNVLTSALSGKVNLE